MKMITLLLLYAILTAYSQAQAEVSEQNKEPTEQLETCGLSIEKLVSNFVQDWEAAMDMLIESLPKDISEYSICIVRSESNPILKGGGFYALRDSDDVTVFVMTSSHPSNLTYWAPLFSAYRK